MTLDDLNRHDEEVAAALSNSLGPDYQTYKKAGVETTDLLAMIIGRVFILFVTAETPAFTPAQAEELFRRYVRMTCAKREAVFARKQ